jgi:hypothetical protein
MQFKSAQKLWNEIKSDETKLITTMNDLKRKAEKQHSAKIYNFWGPRSNTSTDISTATATTTSTVADKPAQRKVMDRLAEVNKNISSLTKLD